MGFWGTLGRIGAIAGPIAAIPFTGGASGSLLGMAGLGAKGAGIVGGILGAAGKIAPALGAAASGRAEGRVQQAGINNQQDQLALARARLQNEQTTGQNVFNLGRYNAGLNTADVDLARRKFALTAPGQRAGNSVRGDILANAQDVSIAGLPSRINVPQISGGLRPSMFSGNTRALGANMSAQALADQQKGDTFDALPALPDYQTPQPIPGLTPQPQAGAFDKILTTAGTIGSLAGTFGDVLKKYKQPSDYHTPPFVGGDYGPATPPNLTGNWSDAAQMWEDPRRSGGGVPLDPRLFPGYGVGGL